MNPESMPQPDIDPKLEPNPQETQEGEMSLNETTPEVDLSKIKTEQGEGDEARELKAPEPINLLERLNSLKEEGNEESQKEVKRLIKGLKGQRVYHFTGEGKNRKRQYLEVKIDEDFNATLTRYNEDGTHEEPEPYDLGKIKYKERKKIKREQDFPEDGKKTFFRDNKGQEVKVDVRVDGDTYFVKDEKGKESPIPKDMLRRYEDQEGNVDFSVAVLTREEAIEQFKKKNKSSAKQTTEKPTKTTGATTEMEIQEPEPVSDEPLIVERKNQDEVPVPTPETPPDVVIVNKGHGKGVEFKSVETPVATEVLEKEKQSAEPKDTKIATETVFEKEKEYQKDSPELIRNEFSSLECPAVQERLRIEAGWYENLSDAEKQKIKSAKTLDDFSGVIATIDREKLNEVANLDGLVRIPDDYEVIAATDLHGDIKALDGILKNSDFEKRARTDKVALVVMGDFVDRGDYSFELTKRLFQLKKKYGNKVVIMKADHEDIDKKHGEYRVAVSPAEFTENVIEAGDQEAEELYEKTFKNLPYMAVHGKKIITHAGLPVPLEFMGNGNVTQEKLNDFLRKTEESGIGSLIGLKTTEELKPIQWYDMGKDVRGLLSRSGGEGEFMKWIKKFLSHWLRLTAQNISSGGTNMIYFHQKV